LLDRVESYGRLAGELTLLLRAMKDLHAHALESLHLPCEMAGAFVLARLEALGPIRLTGLAQALGLDPSSVSRQVTALERAGLVVREPDPGDLRAHQLVLTDRGTAAVAALGAARAEALATLTPGWSSQELDDLTDRLARLRNDIATHRALLGARQEIS
jgi:DNA-binding MarR family transcriptional regulator